MARSQALKNILNMVNEDIAVEQQFLNDLKASIELCESTNKRKPSQSYKPSSLHCIRNMYYQVTGAEEKSDRASSELIGICESGTDRHNRIQQAVMHMRDNNIDCEYIDVAKFVNARGFKSLKVIEQSGNETKLFNTELNMSFLCDGIVRYKDKYYILEIKTESSNKFWTRSGVNPEHILQGTAYSLNFELDDVIFLYECRDNCNKKCYMLHVTDEMRDALRNKIKNCDNYIKDKVVPPIPVDVSKTTCAYCNYSLRCKIDG